MSAPPQSPTDQWTIGRLLAWTRAHFESHQLDEPRLCAELLLARAMGLKRIDLYARFDERPTDAQRDVFRDWVRAAAQGEPIAYLIGTREFYSLEFAVTRDVLIPRPETELLVEQTLAWCRGHPRDRYDLLDLGTGSGCIAVTLAKRLPSAHVVATDISEPALAVARANAARHAVERVRFIRADLFDFPDDAYPTEGFDVIVSNPPYVAEQDRAALPPNVRDHEPAVALFAGNDGLSILRRIAESAARRLKREGLLLVEIGYDQADAVEAMFAAQGGYAPATRYKDAAGIDRALAFTLSA